MSIVKHFWAINNHDCFCLVVILYSAALREMFTQILLYYKVIYIFGILVISGIQICLQNKSNFVPIDWSKSHNSSSI